MKKVLLTLLTLFAVGGVWAQVTETDRSSYLDVIYAESSQVLQGTTDFKLPINIKAHQNFTAVEFVLVLPDDVEVNDLAGMEDSRKQYVKTKGSEIYEYNDLGDGSYKIVGTVTCDRGLASGDGAFSYVSLDVSKLSAGDYSLIVKNATLSGFQNAETGVATGEADAVIADEIVTTLTITDRLVFDEASETLPSYSSGTVGNVTVKRTVKANTWSTIVLPFKLTPANAKIAFGDNVKFAEFDGMETTIDEETLVPSAINFKFKTYSISSLKPLGAGKPYLVYTDKDVESFDLDNVELVDAVTDVVKADANYSEVINSTLKGTFVKTVIPENGLFISGNKFYYSKGTTNLKGYRAWFSSNAIIGTALDVESKVTFTVDGEATTIDGIVYQRIVEGVYDLSGRKIQLEGNDLNKLQKGVYIIDGKKVTIK